MDFFSRGGYQRLLNDLSGFREDLPTRFHSELNEFGESRIEVELYEKDILINSDTSCVREHGHPEDNCVKSSIEFAKCKKCSRSGTDFGKNAMYVENDNNYNHDILHLDETSCFINNCEENNSNGNLESVGTFTKEITEWEENFLDNYIEIPELIEILPEKTPLCTELCEHFFNESSRNLNLQHDSKRATNDIKYDKGFICNFGSCKKIYAKPAHLKAHLRRHKGEKPYICSWPGCTWKFSRSDELSRHRRSHSGVKPYRCTYCSKCFARSDHLSKHRKVHERRLLAASKMCQTFDEFLQLKLLTVRPGRKKKNQSY